MTSSIRGFTAPWRELYLAALFESDATMGDRIAIAEKVLVQREHALLGAPNSDAERQAIRNALDALRALRIAQEVRARSQPHAA